MVQHLSKLAHDVGKQITRTAINLSQYPLTPPLLRLLVADLYCLDGASPASAVFERCALPIETALGSSPELDGCRNRLKRIDNMEEQVRAGDEAAVGEAAALAIEISKIIIEMRREWRPGSHE
jgi:hypothetical protein